MSNINNDFPLCSIIKDDFNARCSRWWKNDITNSAGQEINSLTSSAGYKQIIDKPTRVINTFVENMRSCIDLIFSTNQNVIFNYGVDFSMFKICHHNIIHGNIDIWVPFPTLYIVISTILIR